MVRDDRRKDLQTVSSLQLLAAAHSSSKRIGLAEYGWQLVAVLRPQSATPAM